jgi:actin-like ATPase involved in cell morphogenesis
MKANSSKSAGASAVLDAAQPRSTAETLLVGLDWGTNTSSVVTALRGSAETLTKELVPTVVGYANDDVLPGVLPGDAKVLFGRMALKHKSNLHLVRPLQGGVIHDTEAAGEFMSPQWFAPLGRS